MRAQHFISMSPSQHQVVKLPCWLRLFSTNTTFINCGIKRLKSPKLFVKNVVLHFITLSHVNEQCEQKLLFILCCSKNQRTLLELILIQVSITIVGTHFLKRLKLCTITMRMVFFIYQPGRMSAECCLTTNVKIIYAKNISVWETDVLMHVPWRIGLHEVSKWRPGTSLWKWELRRWRKFRNFWWVKARGANREALPNRGIKDVSGSHPKFLPPQIWKLLFADNVSRLHCCNSNWPVLLTISSLRTTRVPQTRPNNNFSSADAAAVRKNWIGTH